MMAWISVVYLGIVKFLMEFWVIYDSNRNSFLLLHHNFKNFPTPLLVVFDRKIVFKNRKATEELGCC